MDRTDEPGARANQGFGAPGGKAEQRTGRDRNPPAPKDDDMAQPAKDGLDPQAMKKRIESEGEIIADEQLRERGFAEPSRFVKQQVTALQEPCSREIHARSPPEHLRGIELTTGVRVDRFDRILGCGR